MKCLTCGATFGYVQHCSNCSTVERKQIGWYNLKKRRFCYIVEKEWSPVTHSSFTVPVFIEEE